MADTLRKRGPYNKGLRADYGDATPQQVARAMMRSAPRKRVETIETLPSPTSSFWRRFSRLFVLREKRV